MKLKEIYDYINSLCPFDTQLSFDNAGLLVGDFDKEIHKIGVCLDVTKQTMMSAVEQNIDLIISHHPVIWNDLKQISSDDVVYDLVKNDIAVISAHTNLDAAKNGVCETLCDVLDVHDLENAYLDEFPNSPIGRLGTIDSEMSPDDFAKFLKQRLNSPDVRFCGNNTVRKVGIFNGAGSDLIPYAISHGADSVVTSEVKHHEWLYATAKGINIFDVGHYFSENVIVSALADIINEKFDLEAVIIPQNDPYTAI